MHSTSVLPPARPPMPPTYTLKPGDATSEQYYTNVAAMAGLVTSLGEELVGALATGVAERASTDRAGEVRTRDEYLYDVLMLGVLWRCRGGRAERTPRAVTAVLGALVALRQRSARMKPAADRVRGWLAPVLLPGDGRGEEGAGVPARDGLRRLLRWLAATGEYRAQVPRLERVVDQLASFEVEEYVRQVDGMILFADRFLRAARVRLGRYTVGVERWVRTAGEGGERREDRVMRLRPRDEYHLDMVGAEVLNRGLRAGYADTRERALLLPACMRGPHAAQCKARREDLDMVCTGCSPACRVHALSRMAAERGVRVHLIPHSTDFTRWLRTWAADRDLGVVGVACVPHLITGGLELRALGIPAQCVLLDASGCAAHWDPAGPATELNEQLLRAMLDARSCARDAAAA